jgi:hypothetical protein
MHIITADKNARTRSPGRRRAANRLETNSKPPTGDRKLPHSRRRHGVIKRLVVRVPLATSFSSMPPIVTADRTTRQAWPIGGMECRPPRHQTGSQEADLLAQIGTTRPKRPALGPYRSGFGARGFPRPIPRCGRQARFDLQAEVVTNQRPSLRSVLAAPSGRLTANPEVIPHRLESVPAHLI